MVHFNDVKDPRIERKKLIDIIIIAICAVVAGADSFDDIEVFGNAHKDWFKKFLKFSNGIPSHDTLKEFSHVLILMNSELVLQIGQKSIAGIFTDVIAIDGQTHRGARKKGQIKSPIHMLSAWATGLRLVLAQKK